MKAPRGADPGIVTFTTAERDQVINAAARMRDAVARLKPSWIVGLHHNWHDHQFEYDPLFDFSMAGPDDLVEVSGQRVPLVQLDACNFVPDCFHGGGEKFWDLLYVARPVAFKGFDELLDCVRRLYDAGHALRVLCIAPVPPEGADGVRVRYDELFDQAEQDLFNLLTLDFRYPFPFDLPSLAHFYRSSRVFVHFAPDERRCRVAAYAWASRLPVVGLGAVGSLLPDALRREPFYFEPRDYPDFDRAILAALGAAAEEHDFGPVAAEVTERCTVPRLMPAIAEATKRTIADGPETAALRRLDIRLGRHHGLASGINRVDMPIPALLECLGDAELVGEAVRADVDPEAWLARRAPTLCGPSPKRRWRRPR